MPRTRRDRASGDQSPAVTASPAAGHKGAVTQKPPQFTTAELQVGLLVVVGVPHSYSPYTATDDLPNSPDKPACMMTLDNQPGKTPGQTLNHRPKWR